MKYIRTKDRIMEIPENKQHLRFLQDFKQVDTIEELCDEFVVVGYSIMEKPMLISGTQFPFSTAKNYLNSCKTIYGAIWTDKGLIYVAKMNEKGEMELLCQ